MKMISKKKVFYFFVFFIGFWLGGFTLSHFMAKAEEKNVEMSSPDQFYDEIEKSFSESLPQIQEELEAILKNLQSPKRDLIAIKIKLSKLETMINRVRTDQNFNPLVKFFDRISPSITQADDFLKQGDFEKSRTALRQTVVRLKILSHSPILKMTEAQIDLQQSDEAIRKKDYAASEEYLKKAINHIDPLLKIQNPKIVSHLQKIKSDLIVLQQQTILGKQMEELKEKSIWRRMQQVQVDALAHYYELWNRTYRPWERE